MAASWRWSSGCGATAARGISTCTYAMMRGPIEVLRWIRENGCPWEAATRDQAAAELGYTDDLGNLVELSDDDEYNYEYW